MRRMSFRSHFRFLLTFLVGLGWVGQYFNPFTMRYFAPQGVGVPLHRLWHVDFKGLP